MNKKAAVERLESLKEEVRQLEAIIKTPGDTGTGIIIPKKESGANLSALAYRGHTGLYEVSNLSYGNANGIVKAAFKNKQIAQHWADALNTLLMLRAMPGATTANYDEDINECLCAVSVDSDGDIDWNYCCDDMSVITVAVAWFTDSTYAQDAITKHEKEIRSLGLTLMGLYDKI